MPMQLLQGPVWSLRAQRNETEGHGGSSPTLGQCQKYYKGIGHYRVLKFLHSLLDER